MIGVFQSLKFIAIFGLARGIPGDFACTRLDASKLTVQGLVGNVYYYPWTNFTGGQLDTDDFLWFIQTELTSNPNIITEDDGHSLFEPATIATNVLLTNGLWDPEGFSLKRDNLVSESIKLDSREQPFETWNVQTGLTLEDGSNPLVPTTNYFMHVSGYFVPKVTGEYSFGAQVDRALLLIALGNGNFEDVCCEDPESIISYSATGYHEYENLVVEDSDFLSAYLFEGEYYPINFIYGNLNRDTGYFFYFKDPDSNQHTDFSDYFVSTYDFNEQNVCNYESSVIFEDVTQTTYSYGGIDETLYVTTTVNNVQSVETISTVTTVEYIVEPYPTNTTIEYIPYSGSTTGVFSIETTANTVSKVVEVITYIDVPYSTFNTTSTEFDSTISYETISTFTTTVTPISGAPVVSDLIVDKIPDGHNETKIFTANSHATPSTYSTEFVTVTGDNNIPTITTVYYVYTPYSTYSTVSTKEYSGSLVLTETTITSTVTPADSQEAPYVTIITIVDSPISTVSSSTVSSSTSTSSSTTSSSTSSFSSTTSSSTSTSSSTTSSSTSTSSSSTFSSTSTANTSSSSGGSTSSTPSSSFSTSSTASSFMTTNSSTSEVLSSASIGAIYSNTTSTTNLQVSPTTSQGVSSSSCVASGLSNTFVGYTATYEIDINFLKAETLYVIAELEQVNAVIVPSIEFDLYNLCTGTKTPVTYIVDQSKTNSTLLSEEITLSSISTPAKEILISTVILPVSENGELSQNINFIVPQYSSKRDTEVVSYLRYEITFSNSTSSVNGPYTLSPEMAFLSYTIGSDESESTSSSTSSGTTLSSTLSVPTLSLTSSGSTLSSTSVVSTNTSDTLTMSTSITSSSVSKTTLETSEFASAQSSIQTSLSDVSATKGSNTNQYSSATPASEEHSTEILSNMQTTVVTITSCGTETCYPVEVTTVVPCSTTDSSGTTNMVTSGSASDTFSKIESLQTDTAIASTTIYPSKSTTIAISTAATSQNVAGNTFTIVSIRALVFLALTNLFIM